ncbi:MAG: hypothetical protein PF569_02565 [Candidatus Woesearchaeota archaeon]|jgi:uncharacterized membrane protein YidH (DUF202 family)|nr:hypothetical protein [Candidatus Woesearchaeota archaeon]
MGFSIMEFWEYLKADADHDRQLKAGLNVIIRFFIVAILGLFEYSGYLDYEGADRIITLATSLTVFLAAKDFLVVIAPVFKIINPLYNLFVETFLLISIIPLSVIFNINEHARSLTKIEPAFLVALSLILIVGALLNWGIAFYNKNKGNDIEYAKYVLFHNAIILVQAFMLLFIGLEYINPIAFSDFYQEMFLYYFGGY